MPFAPSPLKAFNHFYEIIQLPALIHDIDLVEMLNMHLFASNQDLSDFLKR